MPIVSELLNIQAFTLPDLIVVSRDHNAFLMVRNVNGLILENNGDADSWEERIVPGVLVEGAVVKDGVDVDHGDVLITVWADGSMTDIRTDTEAEVEVRFCYDPVNDIGVIPVFDECGRCGRDLLPGQFHVGC